MSGGGPRRRLLIDALPGERRQAWFEDEDLVELRVDRAGQAGAAGDLYLGRVTAVDKGLAAAFLDIGLARPGFLPLHEGPETAVSEGDRLVVKVLRAPSGEKGARLTARLKGPAAHLAENLDAGRKDAPGRLLSGGDPVMAVLTRRPDEILVDDLASFTALKQALAAHGSEGLAAMRLYSDPRPLFEAMAVEEAIDDLLLPDVALPSGGRIKIEPVTSLVAIDVDSARHGGGGDPGRLARDVDLEAAGEVARQLRLRALSGLIVIDFLELARPEDRKAVVARLRAGLKRDPEPARVRPMSPSGLVEMTRRRGRPALYEVLTEPCGLGGTGRRKSALTLAFEALRRCRGTSAEHPAGRPVITAAPPVVAALRDGEAKAAREAFEARLGRPLALRATADLEDYAVDHEL